MHPKKGSRVVGWGGAKSAKYLQNQAKPFVVASWGNNQDSHDSSILAVTGVGQERFLKAERRSERHDGTFGLKLEPWYDYPPTTFPLFVSQLYPVEMTLNENKQAHHSGGALIVPGREGAEKPCVDLGSGRHFSLV